MYEYLVGLSYPKFRKELMKIFSRNLQPKEKIEWERRIMNSEGEVLGVKSDIKNKIRKIAGKRKTAWEEIEKLWNSEICELRCIATEMLQKAKKADKEKLDLVFRLVPTALHWGDTDGLVVHEMKHVIRRNPETAFEYASQRIKSKNKWERRFSMVVLIPLTYEKSADGKYIPRILKLAEKLLKDKEEYVNKAVAWAIKQGHSHSNELIFNFLKKHANTGNTCQIRTIRNAMEYQPKERKEILRKIISKSLDKAKAEQ